MKPQAIQVTLSWLVILGLVGFTFWNQHEAGAKVRASGDEIGLILQTRAILGLSELVGSGDQTEKELSKLNTGPYRQRVLAAILIAEVQGHEKASEHLDGLEKLRVEKEAEPSKDDQKLARILTHLYDPAEPDLADDDRATLEKIAVLGRLALAHAPDADPQETKEVRAAALRAVLLATGLMLLAGGVAIGGLILLVLFFWYWNAGQIQWAVEPRTDSTLYVEAFAVWFIAFMALGRLIHWAMPDLGSLETTGFVMLTTTLLALAWCWLRGRSWDDIRHEIGLHSGRSLWRELLAGVATYAAMLPVLIVAVLVVAGLTTLIDRWQGSAGPENPFAPSSRPSHPIARLILGDVWTIFMIYITAGIIAPLVEEIAFRGLLQRHVRAGLGRVTSGLAVGFVFAIIHPQGLVGVPALMAIALTLSIAREWRGSLVAPIVAHSLNNAGVTTLLLMFVR